MFVGTFSYLLIGVGETRPLWAAPSLGNWAFDDRPESVNYNKPSHLQVVFDQCPGTATEKKIKQVLSYRAVMSFSENISSLKRD